MTTTAKKNHFDKKTVALADVARALSHPARVEILRQLAARRECVCGELVESLPLAQSTVSQHLKVLRDAGLIRGTVEGPSVCYCADVPAITGAKAAFTELFEEMQSALDCC